jgi:type IV pilus assembly protein PilY1
MVLFGTGKYLETTDVTSTAQTMYGIHDLNASISDRTLLTPQGFSSSTTTVAGDRYRTSSVGCDADALTALPDCPVSSKGWYADFPITNERNIGAPIIRSGVGLFTSFIPSTSPCDFGGKSWFYALNYETGEVLTFPVFDTNQDGIVDNQDTIFTGKEIPPTLNPPTIIPDGPVIVSTLEGNIEIFPPIPETGLRGRITWREIVR